MDDRERLLRRLRHFGCTDADIERAAAEHRLATLAVEQALGDGSTHTLTATARESGLDVRFLRELMEVMGRPRPAPREAVFTDDDIELARLAQASLDAGLSRAQVLEVSRVLSLGMTQTAAAARHVVGDAFLQPGDSEFTVGLRYAEAMDQLAPLMSAVLVTEFRSQLRSGLRRHLITEAELEQGRLDEVRDVAVAFADLVDYTRLGESLHPDAVGDMASQLVDLSARAAAPPVSLVKTIGDAAMFVSPDVDAMLDAMLTVVAEVEKLDSEFPSVRVGIAHGRASYRFGDWYGATVNLASRVADASRPSRVLVTDEVRNRSPDRAWKRKRRARALPGISERAPLYSLAVEKNRG